MIDWILNFSVATFTFNSIFGICLYWIPMAICIFGYTVRTARIYQSDLKERAKAEKKEGGGYYAPTDTIGTLIGRAIVSFIPIANLWAGLFDVSPELFGKFFTWVERVFNQPLVPKRKIV